MVFIDPRTGEALDRLNPQICYFSGPCYKCPVNGLCSYLGMSCSQFVRENPLKAAELLGIEVVDEGYDNPQCEQEAQFSGNPMEHPRPKLAEVLGVEVDEKFCIKTNTGIKVDYHVGSGGLLRRGIEMVQGDVVCWVINHPESIIRTPRLTEAELAICKPFQAKWVTKSKISTLNAVHMWSQKPKQLDDGDFSGDDIWLGCVNGDLMRSVQPGDCICVDEQMRMGQ